MVGLGISMLFRNVYSYRIAVSTTMWIWGLSHRPSGIQGSAYQMLLRLSDVCPRWTWRREDQCPGSPDREHSGFGHWELSVVWVCLYASCTCRRGVPDQKVWLNCIVNYVMFSVRQRAYWLKQPYSKSFCNVNMIHLFLQIQNVLHSKILAHVLMKVTPLNIVVVKTVSKSFAIQHSQLQW